MSKQCAKQSSNPKRNPRGAIGLLVSWLDDAAKLQPGSAGVRMDEVVSIRDRLAAGTYNIPSSQVADKLIRYLLNAKL